METTKGLFSFLAFIEKIMAPVMGLWSPGLQRDLWCVTGVAHPTHKTGFTEVRRLRHHLEEATDIWGEDTASKEACIKTLILFGRLS